MKSFWLPRDWENPFYKLWVDAAEGDDKTAIVEYEGGHFSEWRERDDKNMTREAFETECRSICIHCREGIALRQRTDTSEWCHDGAIAIPGTLGRRQSHAICMANDYRNEHKDDIRG